MQVNQSKLSLPAPAEVEADPAAAVEAADPAAVEAAAPDTVMLEDG